MPHDSNLAVSLALDMRAKFCIELGKIQHCAVNTDRLVEFIAKETNHNVKIETDCRFTDTRGKIIRFVEKKALILIAGEDVNTKCWERFTVVKEACHLFLDSEKDFSTNIAEKLNGLISREIENQHYAKEVEAVIAAIELLIPSEFSTSIAHMSNVEKKTSFEIATIFRVPLIYMEYRMKKWSIPIEIQETE